MAKNKIKTKPLQNNHQQLHTMMSQGVLMNTMGPTILLSLMEAHMAKIMDWCCSCHYNSSKHCQKNPNHHNTIINKCIQWRPRVYKGISMVIEYWWPWWQFPQYWLWYDDGICCHNSSKTWPKINVNLKHCHTTINQCVLWCPRVSLWVLWYLHYGWLWWRLPKHLFCYDDRSLNYNSSKTSTN